MRNSNQPRTIRCAIYTRKSTEEGLEQDFNSLDAQREACAAYIMSQRHEGWASAPDYYEDGGYSGGNMDRPGLKALLAEVAAGRIDVIVVYKVDRLTRSLADFAKIVEVLDDADASFVSVTQSFNTTTSMGRLTLNVLLSFAQFEREVTGERIRDKIAASKAKGMWMGGPVPLGYRLEDRKLFVDPDEAEKVAAMFTRYLELRSGRQLVAELDAKGVRSKSRVNRHGRSYGEQPISRGALYAILQNRLYIGEVSHKGQHYPGQHEAIISLEVFDEVQQVIATARVERRLGTNASEPSLLAGMICDELGRAMSPTHAVKAGKRYRYYASQTDGDAGTAEPAYRVSAGDIEKLVSTKVERAIRDMVADRIARGDLGPGEIANLELASQSAANNLTGIAAPIQRETLLRFVHRIALGVRTLDIEFDLSSLHHTFADAPATSIATPIGCARAGKRIRLILPAAEEKEPPRNPALLKLVAWAFKARREMDKGGTVPEVAARLEVSREHLADMIRTSFLAPSIITAILDGTQPATLTRKQLVQARQLPRGWDAQRRMFGFA